MKEHCAIYRGLVSNNVDPEGLFRIRCIVPQIFGDDQTETDWAWPVFPAGAGTIVPLPHQPVWVQFIGGDLDYPVWTGTWNTENSPPSAPSGPGFAQVPVGGSIDWWSDTLPAPSPQITWLFLHGQTVSEGALLYPELPRVYPNWLAPNHIDLIMPDTRQKFVMGADVAGGGHGPAAGTTGGQASATLTTAYIPRFNSIAVSITDNGHVHSDSGHGHTDSGHSHLIPGGYQIMIDYPGSTDHLPMDSGTWGVSFSQLANGSANIQNGNANIQNHTTGISGTVSFGQTTPTPVPTVPPWVACHKIVRAL